MLFGASSVNGIGLWGFRLYEVPVLWDSAFKGSRFSGRGFRVLVIRAMATLAFVQQ